MDTKTVSQTRDIHITIPRSFVVPGIFMDADPEIHAIILRLGVVAYETVIKDHQSFTHEALYDSLKETAEKEYRVLLKEIQGKLLASESTASSLRSRVKLQEEEHLSLEKRVREEERRNREEIVCEKNMRIEQLERGLKGHLSNTETVVRDSQRVMLDGFQTFKEQIVRSTTGSSAKGRIGEQGFGGLLLTAFGSVGVDEEFELEGVGKEGYQGDLHMKWKGQKIMWEVKNYTRTVEDKEVLKFKRDMEQNVDFSIGVMVSLNSGIAHHTKAGDIDLQQLPDGRVLVYLTNFMRHENTLVVIQGLKPFLETFMQRRPNIDKMDSGEEDSMRQKLSRFEQQRTVLLRLLQHHTETIRGFKNTVLNAKKKQEQIWIEITTEIRQTEHNVKLLLETFLDTDSDLLKESVKEGITTTTTQRTESEDSNNSPIPGYVFRHTDWALYNERERKFLRDSLRLFTFSQDSSCSTKTIKDVYKSIGYSNDFVDTMRSLVFLEGIWEKGKKEVKYIRVRSNSS